MQKSGKRNIAISALSLKAILDQSQFRNCSLICDIEGNEIDLIDHESDIIKEKVSTIFVEVHPRITGQTAVDNLISRLQSLGFEVRFNRWSNIVLQKTRSSSNMFQQSI